MVFVLDNKHIVVACMGYRLVVGVEHKLVVED